MVKENIVDSIIANSKLDKQYYTIPEVTKMFTIVKPGGHVLLFVSTLTQDIMGVNARLAGFEVRDSIHIPAYKANIIVCRKPLSESTVATNTLKWGTGGLNIDASRVGYASETDGGDWDRFKGHQSSASIRANLDGGNGKLFNDRVDNGKQSGRFPANIILDETTAEMLDEQADASRFFYVANSKKQLLNYLKTLITPVNGKCVIK